MINIESVTSSLQKDAASFCKKLCQKSLQQKLLRSLFMDKIKAWYILKKIQEFVFKLLISHFVDIYFFLQSTNS